MNHPIVKYSGKWWMFEKIVDNKAILWSNGECVKIDINLIESQINKGE